MPRSFTMTRGSMHTLIKLLYSVIVYVKANVALSILIFITFLLALFSFARAFFILIDFPYPLDFAQFYISGYIFRISPGESIYDPLVLCHYSDQIGIPAPQFNYPPIVEYFFYPFSLISFKSATGIWLGINIFSILFVECLILKLFFHQRKIICFLSILLVFHPSVLNSLILGQITPVIGLMLLLTIVLVNSHHKINRLIASVILGLAIAIKIWPFLISGYFFIRKKYLIAFGSIGVAAILTLLAAFPTGIENSIYYFGKNIPVYRQKQAIPINPINQSIWGVSARLFLGGATQRYQLSAISEQIFINPIIKSEILFWALPLTYCLFAVYASLKTIRKIPFKLLKLDIEGYWLTTIIAITMLPFSWDHYSYFVIFPIIYLFLSSKTYPPDQLFKISVISSFLLLLSHLWGWFPPLSYLYAFGFLSELIIGVVLISSIKNHIILLNSSDQIIDTTIDR